MSASPNKSSRSGSRHKQERKHDRKRRLNFESLENRMLLAAVIPACPASHLAHAAIVADLSPSLSLSPQHTGEVAGLSGTHVGRFAGTYKGTTDGKVTVTVGRKTAVYNVT